MKSCFATSNMCYKILKCLKHILSIADNSSSDISNFSDWNVKIWEGIIVNSTKLRFIYKLKMSNKTSSSSSSGSDPSPVKMEIVTEESPLSAKWKKNVLTEVQRIKQNNKIDQNNQLKTLWRQNVSQIKEKKIQSPRKKVYFILLYIWGLSRGEYPVFRFSTFLDFFPIFSLCSLNLEGFWRIFTSVPRFFPKSSIDPVLKVQK